jgi:hypothetical protein
MDRFDDGFKLTVAAELYQEALHVSAAGAETDPESLCDDGDIQALAEKRQHLLLTRSDVTSSRSTNTAPSLAVLIAWVEGEATAMYISGLIKPLGMRVTRIASGLPVGGDIDYADEVTLGRALEGRREV